MIRVSAAVPKVETGIESVAGARKVGDQVSAGAPVTPEQNGNSQLIVPATAAMLRSVDVVCGLAPSRV